MTRARLVILAAFAGNLGWGAILPYQYAYTVDARHWGASVGVLTGTLFCLGAVLAAPIAGRLADRWAAAPLAVGAELLSAVAAVLMGFAGSPVLFLAAIALLGAAVTAAQPPTQVLLLESSDAVSRRAAFAYQFTAMALGMAVGSFAAGWVVDLTSPTGMLPAFAAAAAGFLGSAALLSRAGRTSYGGTAPRLEPSASRAGHAGELTGRAAYRVLAGNRRVRLLAIASMLLAAGFYAQFETGLPAFALESLHVRPTTVGTAAAVNCLVIVGLQWLVVRITGRHSGALLLGIVGGLWVLSWLLLEAALFTGRMTAAAVFVVAFGVFAVGETMYAPVLGPLAAAVAPEGMVGTTLGALSALRTAVSAVGPLVAGVLVASDLPHVYVAVHVAVNAAAVLVAWRLLGSLRPAGARVDAGLDNGRTESRSVRV